MATSKLQNLPTLTAEGRALRGFGCSAAARPTSSVPAKEKAAVTKTEHRPAHKEVRAVEAKIRVHDARRTFEAIREGSWVVKQAGAIVFSKSARGGTTSKHEDESREEENDDDREFKN